MKGKYSLFPTLRYPLFFFLLILVPALSKAQSIQLKHVEPPFWWKGFKNPELQVMVHAPNIASTTVTIEKGDITLSSVEKVENPNYLFLNLYIPPKTKQNKVLISFTKGGKVVSFYSYEIKERRSGSANRQSFSSSDVIYLLMPDRFANGDTTNDNLPGMRQLAERSNPDGRHGGDLKGIQNHVDYIAELGATAVWVNPVMENNMSVYSYHGYAITDYYKVDARYGSNEDYVKLNQAFHQRGVKVIMDMVFNHCGIEHWWMSDLPQQDWVSQWNEFTRTSYRSSVVTDPYDAELDHIQFNTGWFDKTMPDLNQHNKFLANYLIQNSIWWIEYADLDGIRQDTHPYPFKDFMADWCKTVLNEYPNFNIVGECWLTTPAGIAYWQKDARNADKYNSNLPSVFDFAMYDALRMGLSEKDGWSTGIARLYEILCQDFVYSDPSKIVVFADNHDVNRFLDSQNDDIRKLKMAMAFILTSRGIPEVYYGTEVLLSTGVDKGDGSKRKDFPGGWLGDQVNGFSGVNLSDEQKDMQKYMRLLMNWRKNKEVVHSGKLTQFIPKDGVYVYFRSNEKEAVMVAMNNNEVDKKLESNRYVDFLEKFKSGKEVISGSDFLDLNAITVPAKSAIIIELKP